MIKKSVKEWIDKVDSGELSILQLQRIKHNYKTQRKLNKHIDVGIAIMILQFDAFRNTGRYTKKEPEIT